MTKEEKETYLQTTKDAGSKRYGHVLFPWFGYFANLFLCRLDFRFAS